MKRKLWRSATALFICVTMVLSMVPGIFAADTSNFVDFPTGWSKEAMTAAVDNGLLNGRTENTIAPQGNLTRAEMATIINRAFGATKTADISAFYDVSPSDWFYTEIAKAVNMQTFQGDGGGTMRPNAYISREEVFAVVARSLVLETQDFSALSNHPDGNTVADWAKPYAAILSQKKYINGDQNGNLNPKANITREEFAQIMHNIIKTYYTTASTFSHSGSASSLIRTSGVTLSDVTINGDLIIGDGVGNGTVVLNNVTIKGRLLARGGEQSVKLTNTTVGEIVVVKDVNGIVHFDNYRSEEPFKGIREITKATFIGESVTPVQPVTPPSGGGGGGGGGGGSSTTKEYTFKTYHYRQKKDRSGYEDKPYETVVSKKKYKEGTWVAPEKISIEGYTLNESMSELEDKRITASGTTFNLYYTIDPYVVTFKISDTQIITKKYYWNEKIGSGELGGFDMDLLYPDKVFYDKSTNKIVTEETVVTGPMEIIAKNADDFWTVTFVLKNGTEDTIEQAVEKGSSLGVNMPADPQWQGEGNYKFDGWINVADDSPFTKDTPVTGDFRIEAKWVEKTNKAPYKIIHYQLKLGGDPANENDYNIIAYEKTISDKFIGDTVNAPINHSEYTGFVYNDSATFNVTTGIITEDGKLELKLYYTRKTFNVSYDYDGGTLGTNVELDDGTKQFGYEITLPGKTALTKKNYNLTGWFVNGVPYKLGEKIIINEEKDYVIKADWTEDGKASYTIKIYKLKVGGTNGNDSDYVYSGGSTEEGYVDDEVEVTPETLTGFELNASKSVTSGTIKDDHSLVISLYYDRKTFTVTHNMNGGTITDNSVSLPQGEKMQFEASITLPRVNQVHKDGHYLDKWNVNGVECEPGSSYTISTEADVNIVPVWKKYDLVDYTVKYYVAKLNATNLDDTNSYEVKETDIKKGEVDSEVQADIRTYTGFTHNGAFADREKGIVTKDGKLVLEVYYTRNNVNVAINIDGGILSDGYTLDHGTKQFGAEIQLPGESDVTKEHYTLSGWIVNKGTENEKSYAPGKIVTIEEDVTYEIEAIWTEDGKTSYTIKTYKLELDGVTYKETDSDIINNVFVNTDVELKAEDFEDKIYGFSFNDGKSKLKGNTGNGGLVLEVYYDRKSVALSYELDGGTEVSPIDKSDKLFGYTLTLPTADAVRKDSNKLKAWKIDGTEYAPGAKYEIVAEGTVTITAVWEELEPVKYTIEHYHEKLDENTGTDDRTYAKAETEEKTAIPDTWVSAEPKDYTGFERDATQAGDETGKVAADGSLVLKVYYNRKMLEFTTIPDGWSFVDNYIDDFGEKYFGDEITLPGADNVVKENNTLTGWTVNGKNYEPGATIKIDFYVDQVVEVIPIWLEQGKGNYTYAHYKLKIGGTPGNIADYESVEAGPGTSENAGKEVSVDFKTYEGFAPNEDISNPKGTIVANDTIELKLYYDRNSYSVAYKLAADESFVDGFTPIQGEAIHFETEITLPTDQQVTKKSHKLIGWVVNKSTANEKEYKPGERFVLGTDGASIEPVWEKLPDVTYTVEHWAVNDNKNKDNKLSYSRLDDETEEFTVEADTVVNAKAKQIKGLIWNEDEEFKTEMSGTAVSGKSLVLKVYYYREVINVTYSFGTGVTDASFVTAPRDGEFQFGEEFRLPKISDVKREGYTLAGWQIGNTAHDPGDIVEITEVSDISIVAIWNEKGKTSYTIKHYQLKVGGTSGNVSDYLFKEDTVETDVLPGKEVTAEPEDYYGFVHNKDMMSEASGTVEEDGSLVLKLYYDRVKVDVKFNFDGGTKNPEVEFDEGKKDFGATIELPGIGSVTKDDYELTGWLVNGEEKSLGETITIETEEKVEIKAKWSELYEYTIKYYMQTLDKSDYVVDEDLTETKKAVEGKTVKVTEAQVITGFTHNKNEGILSGVVTSDGSLELKVYYDRNTIKLSYDFSNGGGFVEGFVPTDSVIYGSTITLPATDNVEYGFDVLKSWSFNGNTYEPGQEVVIEGFDPENGWIFTAVWETTIVYNVEFRSAGHLIHSEQVPAGTSVPEDKIPGSGTVDGYVKNERISPTLYSNENVFTHKVKFGWFYNPTTQKWEKFTHEVKVTSEIVDENGVLTVEERSPKLSIYTYVDKIGLGFTFERYYEPTVKITDGSGNTTITGTRAADTLKNLLWDSFSDSETTLQKSLQAEIEKLGDKGFDKLREKGILDEANNILIQEIMVKFSQIIGEEELEDYIIDNAKESLKKNNELKTSILDYFEKMANSENPDDVKSVKGLIKEAVDRAISTDSNAESMVRDICEEMLSDSALVKKALKKYVGYDVEVTDDDLQNPAKDSVIKWTKDLIESDESFRSNVKQKLVDHIVGMIRDDDDFFNKVVAINFKGTPFDHITKPDSNTTTTDVITEIVENEFEKMSADDLAKELGYDDLHDLFINRKADIISVLEQDLEDPDFFNHVISTTDFAKYTYAHIKESTTHDIIVEFVTDSIDNMIDSELADFAGYASVDEMLDDAKSEIAKAVVSDMRDTAKTVYEDAVEKLTGKKFSEIPSEATSKDLFKLVLKKVVGDAEKSGDYEELEKMTGEDLSQMSDDEIALFFDNFETLINDDNVFGEYLLKASYGKYTIDTDTNPEAQELPADNREMLASFVELRFKNDADSTFAKFGYSDADIIAEARQYAKDEAIRKIEDPSDSFLVDQIKDHIGVEYASYADVPTDAFDLVVDAVKDKVEEATDIDDDLAHELGYDNQKTLFAEIKHLLVEDTVEKLRADKDERDRYIEKYSGITFDEPIKDNAMDFIVQYAHIVLDDMTYAEIEAELKELGYTQEQIDSHIESYIDDNIEDIIESEFGYCPENIDTISTKQFIIELVLNIFDTDEEKRELIIDEAIDHLVEKGDLSDFEEYVDHAIDYLGETGELDTIIDEIIESKYRQTLDKMISQLINDDEFEIEPANSFILSAFEMQVLDYTFEDLIEKVPEQAFKIYPREVLERIYNEAYNELLDKIDEGKLANENGETAVIPTGLTFRINVIDDGYVILRDRFVELVDGRAGGNYYYAENPYLQELVRLTQVENLFVANTGVGTGYALRSYRDYYDLMLKLAIIGDDALVWYTEELTEEELDELVLNYEDLAVKYANLLAEMLYEYAETGEIPDRFNNKVTLTIEKKLYEKFGSQIDKLLDWYKTSPFYKEYGSEDYAKLRKVVNKAFTKINITTDEAFDLFNKAYEIASGKFDEVGDITDKITQIDENTYEISFKGKTLRVMRIDDNTYHVIIEGKTASVKRYDDGNCFEIAFEGNLVKITRSIVE